MCVVKMQFVGYFDYIKNIAKDNIKNIYRSYTITSLNLSENFQRILPTSQVCCWWCIYKLLAAINHIRFLLCSKNYLDCSKAAWSHEKCEWSVMAVVRVENGGRSENSQISLKTTYGHLYIYSTGTVQNCHLQTPTLRETMESINVYRK